MTVLDEGWWAGLSSAERAAAGRPSHAGPVDAAAAGRLTEAEWHAGRRWLAAWREGRFVPGGAIDPVVVFGLDEERTIALRVAPQEVTAPEWLRVLAEAWPGEPAGCRTAGGPAPVPTDADASFCCCAGDPAPVGADADAAFLAWIAPLTGWAVRDLRGRLPVDHPVRENPAVLALDERPLLDMIKRVLVLELNVAREERRLCGATGRERFACFAGGLRRPGHGRAILRRYPVLAGQLIEHLAGWSRTRSELIHRLVADEELITAAFGLTRRDIAGLVAIREAGDPHRGGRAVAVVEMPGDSLVYKPRPLTLEARFAEFLRWLDAQGVRHDLSIPPVLDRGAYGWASFVRWQPCADPAGIDRFYWRMGAHLAVFHLLRGYDLHMYNVIAVGERPAFVDIEAMFHAPAAFEEVDDLHGVGVGTRIRESVMATLMVPQPQVTQDGDDVRALDISGLGGGRALRLRADVDYADPGTDRMRVVRVRHRMPEAHHRPGPAPDRPHEVVPAATVVSGFTECYRLLCARRAELLAPDGPLAGMRDVEVRSVLRDTSTYTALLAESYHPDLLRDALDRECFVALLAARGGLAEHPEITDRERRQLLARDVPVFTVAAGSTTLDDPAGPVREEHFAQSGWSHVRDRLRGMGEADLADQVWFIEASLATAGSPVRPPRRLLARPVAPPPPIDAACRIADRLVSTVVRDENGDPEWVTLNDLADQVRVVGATPLGLGAGVTGIALFLAELGRVVDEPRYRKLAEDVVAGLAPDDPPAVEDLAGMSPGAFEDLGSVALLFARLDELWGTSLLDPAADWLTASIVANALAGDAADVEQGAAGATLALASMHRARPTADLRAAIAETARATAHLSSLVPPPTDLTASRAEPVLSPAGLGRGLPGCALALAVAGLATGADEFPAAAADAWSRSRRAAGGPASLGWRRGAAGTVLAAAALAELGPPGLDRGELLADLRRAAAALARAADGRTAMDDSLSEGMPAIAHALRAASALTPDDYLDGVAARLTSDVTRRVLDDASVGGAPGGVWTPGLLDGGAGIGYGLLAASGELPLRTVLTCYAG